MTNTDHNKQVVRDFYELAFNGKQPAEAVEQFVGPPGVDPVGVVSSGRWG